MTPSLLGCGPVVRAISRSLGPALAVALVLATLPVPAVAQVWDTGAEAGGTTVAEVVADPLSFYGEIVMLPGEVVRVLGPRSFVMREDDVLAEGELPVVTVGWMLDRQGDPIDAGALLDSLVLVTGEVRPFDLLTVEDELGLDLDDAAWAEWAGRPAILARSVIPWSPRGMPRALPPAASGETVPTVTVDQVTDDPSTYFGQTVTVIGEVSEPVEWHALRLADTDLLFDEELLVVIPRPLQARMRGSLGANRLNSRVVAVTGTIVPYDAVEVERVTGFGGEFRPTVDWDPEAMLVARFIRPITWYSEMTPGVP